MVENFTPLTLWQAVSAGAGAGLLQKLGRVLREKAATDLERITKGTSKTREKLGVRRFSLHNTLSNTILSTPPKCIGSVSHNDGSGCG